MKPHTRWLAPTFLVLASLPRTASTQESIHPDLTPQAVRVHNRAATTLGQGERVGLHLDGRPGDGVAWIPDLVLGDGIIDVEIRGRDRPNQSFVGVAFRGLDDDTYEGVYLRPFNFRSEDPARRAHSVQYISQPDHPWNRLREESPGRYEAALNPAPDPEGWVHLRVALEGRRVTVYVADADAPVLVVDALGGRAEGALGLWVGNNAEGDFAELTFTPR